MTSYGYMIVIIVDLCMIWFHFDCIMQLKKSYYVATNVCRRISATTFGDLPDYSNSISYEMLANCIFITMQKKKEKWHDIPGVIRNRTWFRNWLLIFAGRPSKY